MPYYPVFSEASRRRFAQYAGALAGLPRVLAFGVDPRIVAEGVSHVRFAAALYFLRARADARFVQFIEEAELDGWYFDERHRQAYEWRYEPERVRALLGW